MSTGEDRAARLDQAIDHLIHANGPWLPDEEALTQTARLLRDALPRLHPSFSFEEHLAARLVAARRMESSSAPVTRSLPEPTSIGPLVLPADRRRRNLVAGGAIASGVSLALPIAGAAYVAWRRSRSSGGIL